MEGHSIGLPDVADVGGGLPGFDARPPAKLRHLHHVLWEVPEGIHVDGTLSGAVWIHDHGNISWLSLLVGVLGPHICAGEEGAERRM